MAVVVRSRSRARSSAHAGFVCVYVCFLIVPRSSGIEHAKEKKTEIKSDLSSAS